MIRSVVDAVFCGLEVLSCLLVVDGISTCWFDVFSLVTRRSICSVDSG